MTNVAIRVENISKRYRIGVKEASHDTFAGAAVDFVSTPLRNLRRLRRLSAFKDEGSPDVIWALKDVSFEVKEGEVVGVIGGNGAGKTTLLRILSRITEPTSGKALIRGRVASLLEVGTGFHPELTGRENVYLNGSVLGMSRKETTKNFDEIVDFAEVEQFIDTPLKRYSTGMSMRLAFAVAAHLEPEILLVDEVLAVGDAGFQRKCIAKMDQVGAQGRTILFVSHNMAALTNLCQTAILLDSGQIVAEGPAEEVVRQHLSSFEEGAIISLDEREDRLHGTQLRITRVTLATADGTPAGALRTGEPGQIVLHYRSPTADKFRNVFVRIAIETDTGQRLCTLETSAVGADFDNIGPTGRFICEIPRVPLQPGSYRFSIYVRASGIHLDNIQQAGLIKVDDGDYFGHGKNPPGGMVQIDHTWQYAARNE